MILYSPYNIIIMNKLQNSWLKHTTQPLESFTLFNNMIDDYIEKNIKVPSDELCIFSEIIVRKSMFTVFAARNLLENIFGPCDRSNEPVDLSYCNLNIVLNFDPMISIA